MNKFIGIILLIFIVLSCGKTKEITQSNSQERSRYIEMFHEGVRYKQKKQYHNAIHVFEACTKLNQSDDATLYLLSEIGRAHV
jgi:outer membrane protein assembly factor BamD (BamD/ComL family)